MEVEEEPAKYFDGLIIRTLTHVYSQLDFRLSCSLVGRANRRRRAIQGAEDREQSLDETSYIREEQEGARDTRLFLGGNSLKGQVEKHKKCLVGRERPLSNRSNITMITENKRPALY